MHITRTGCQKGASGSYNNWPARCLSMPEVGGQRRWWKTCVRIHCAWLITWWMRHQASRNLTRRSHRRYFRIPSGPKLQTLEKNWMPDLYYRQSTPSHATTPQVVRYIKIGSILRNVTNTLQECGAGTITKKRTGQPIISRKIWYTIPDSGTREAIITMKTEGRIHRPDRR